MKETPLALRAILGAAAILALILSLASHLKGLSNTLAMERASTQAQSGGWTSLKALKQAVEVAILGVQNAMTQFTEANQAENAGRSTPQFQHLRSKAVQLDQALAAAGNQAHAELREADQRNRQLTERVTRVLRRLTIFT